MEKKKAIKIVTATAIAASAFTAVAPAQSEAAVSVKSQVSASQKAMKKPYTTYTQSKSLASASVMKKQIASAKSAQAKANTAIKNSKNSAKAKKAYYAQVKAYNIYITRAQAYLSAITLNTRAEEKALAAAIEGGNVEEIKAARATLNSKLYQFNKKVAKVYSTPVRNLLKSTYATPAKEVNEAAIKIIADQNKEVVIESVSALDDTNKYLEITFNTKVSGIDASDVQVQDVDTLDRYGVKSVNLSANGKVLTVELYSQDNADKVLKDNEEYKVTVSVNSKPVEYSFVRSAYIKGRIIDIDPNNADLTVVDEKTGEKATVNVPKGVKVDYADALGREARVWYNKDKDLVKVSFEDETVVQDYIEVTETRVGSDEGKIKVAGKEYTLAQGNDFQGFYLNDQETTLGNDGVKYEFAKVFFDKAGDVELIVAYNYDDYIVTSKVDGNVIVAADDQELDLEDYVVFKDGKQITPADVKVGDVIYFETSSNDGDGVAEVLNKTVSGKIDNVYNNFISVGGKNYEYNKGLDYGKKAKYLDGNDFKDLTDTDAEEFQAGGNVTLFLNHKGDLVYITGDQAAVNSNKLGFHSTEAALYYFDQGITDRGTVELEGLNTKKEEKIYKFRVDTLDQITVENKDYEADKLFPATGATAKIDKFALLSTYTGTFAGGNLVDTGVVTPKVVALADNGDFITSTGGTTKEPSQAAVIANLTTVAGDNSVFDVKTNDSGNVKELEFYKNSSYSSPVNSDDNKYIDNYKLLSSTVVFDGTDGWVDGSSTYAPDPEDITLKTWGDLQGKDIDITNSHYYVNEDGEVEYLVIENTTQNDTTTFNAVIAGTPVVNQDDEVVEIKAYVNGVVKTYQVDKVAYDKNTMKKGAVVALDINDATGIIDGITTNVAVDFDATAAVDITGTVDAISVPDRTITVEGTKYDLDTDAKVYEFLDTKNVDTEQFRNIKEGDTVTIAFNPESNKFIDTILLTAEAVSTPVTPTGLVNVDTTALTEGFVSQDVVITSTSGAFAAGAESLVSVTGLPGSYGTVTRVNNTTLKFKITEGADFDANQTATITVPATALTATGATAQTKEIAFTAVDEKFTLTGGTAQATAGFTGYTPATIAGSASDISTAKTVGDLTFQAAALGGDANTLNVAVSALGVITFTITDGGTAGDVPTSEITVNVTGKAGSKLAGKSGTIKFIPAANGAITGTFTTSVN